MFKVNTDGTGFTNLYSFTGGNDGADPTAGFLKLTADDTDDTDAEGCRTSFDIFAFTQRVNTRFEGIFFLSALSAESVVSAAFFTVLRCRVAIGLLI